MDDTALRVNGIEPFVLLSDLQLILNQRSAIIH